jgi:predicted permease
VFYLQDLRYACRQLARNLAFTLLTVIVLGGGLAVSIFTFSFLYTAILKPLPVPQGEEVVRLMQTTGGRTSGVIDAADLAAVRQSVTSLEDLGAFTELTVVVGTNEGTRTMWAAAAEWNIFSATRTPPFLGRGFRPDDQAPGAGRVVVLTYAAWQAVFGGDPGLIDRIVQLNGVPTRVIGVMPRGYAFPVAADAYVLIRPELLTMTTPRNATVQAYARLAPGADGARVTAELTALLRRAQADRPSSTALSEPSGMTVRTFQMAQIDGGPIVFVVPNLLAGLILLLACVNVTNLLLARANERARETAVRLALGASRGRLIVQTAWETVLLAVAGGALGTGLSVWALDAVNSWAHATLTGNLAFWWVWGYDASVLAAAVGFVTLTIVALAAVASRRAVDTEVNAVLQEGSSRASSRTEGRAVRVLVISQVAAVSLLMYFGTLSMIVAYRFLNIDFGYDTRNSLSATLALPADRYPTPEARGMLFQSVLDRLGERAEIEGVALRATLGDGQSTSGDIEIVGGSTLGAPRPRAFVAATLGALTPLGVELQSGRFFTAEDDASGARSALVSRAMAERYWPGRSPLGEQITFTGLGEDKPRAVVGVVSDVLLGEPLSRGRSDVGAYVPLRQIDVRRARVELKYRGSEGVARAAYHETLTLLDPLLVSEVSSLEEILSKSMAIATSTARLLGGCFLFALLLAVSGTYGLMARSIGRRTREIGVRRALGASDAQVLSMLLGQGARQLGIGALLALPVTCAMGWAFSLVFPISFALSIAIALAVSVSIALIVLVATWLPTRRAIAVAPSDALWRD